MQLLDPVGRFQTSPLLHNQPITERLQLFSYHNNIGVLYKGCLRYVRILTCTHTQHTHIHDGGFIQVIQWDVWRTDI